MVWTAIATPGSTQRHPRRKRISLSDYGGNNGFSGTVDNVNMLHQVYKGRFDRLERYRMYDWMDQDSTVSRALDLIAEHCTEPDQDKNYFQFEWGVEEPSEEISSLLNANLKQWQRRNDFKKRLLRNVRNVIKYGDWFYFRNPVTFELYSVHPKHVLGALIDRETNKVLGWIVRNFKFNVENLELSVDPKFIQDSIKGVSANMGPRATKIIPAAHMIHLTMSEGRYAGSTTDDDPQDRYSNRWPFGDSWLEQIYKTFKQLELLEDAAIIHRVQRAPTRNVWYIDVGMARSDKATWMVNNFKNELNQTRIPQFTGQGNIKTVDSVYNPISQLEDYFIPVSMDQRGSKVEKLEGTPWDSLPDMDYFRKKMAQALRVPYAWLVGPSEGGTVFNDGRAGVAYQEEIEFSRFCVRVQNNIIEAFDFEFKLYCKERDVNVSADDYELIFNPPDNYEESKRLSRLQEAISVWSQIKDEPYMSYRFALEYFLGMPEDKIAKNEEMWMEENAQEMMQDNREPGMAGGGGFGAPLGGPMPPPGGAPMGALPGQANSGFAGVMNGAAGADVGGFGNASGAMGAAGAGAMAGGGFGESEMNRRDALFEDQIGLQDLEPAKPRYDIPQEETPDDKLFMAQDWLTKSPITTLASLAKIRRAQMAKRVNMLKRQKVFKKIYHKPMGGMGGGGGLI